MRGFGSLRVRTNSGGVEEAVSGSAYFYLYVHVYLYNYLRLLYWRLSLENSPHNAYGIPYTSRYGRSYDHFIYILYYIHTFYILLYIHL